jgi:serine/threonine protein kinase
MKTLNIFLGKDNSAKLGDFGAAKKLDPDNENGDNNNGGMNA